MFEVSFFSDLETSDHSQFTAPDATLRCYSYDIPAASLELDRNEFLKENYVKSYKVPYEISIAWMEDKDLKVWNYHQQWLANFYNRSADQYITGAEGKKRFARIIIQSFEDPTTTKFNPQLKTTHSIEIHGMIPTAIPPLKGSWDDDASRSTFTIKYQTDRIVYRSGASTTSTGVRL